MAEQSILKGRYELKETLGRGGMGVVHRAYDTVLKCDVAVKTIRDTPDPLALQLFYRECEALAALNHPNIVQILDLGEFEQDGRMRPYFVMPLLQGATLDQLIRNSGSLPVQRSVDVLSQICRGLAAAHERGLVHRDLKPGNIFVMPDDSVEIIDFGVAHMTNAGATGGQKGTLTFMAPELLEMKPPSPLSDIFAMGVMAYQMFTGRRPFERPTEQAIIEAILHEIPPPVSDLNHQVNQTIGRVVHKSMAKQPWHRFSTARDFAECLQKAQHGGVIEYFEPGRIRPRVERAKKAFGEGDYQFASEILLELEAEGHLDPEIPQLHRQIDSAVRQKRVHQLLDGARTRLQEEEYPLALQKVQEALTLEPENVDARGLKTTIESASSEHQIEGWFHLVGQHIDNHAYDHARDALRNVLNARPQDSRAQELLATVNRREQEHVRSGQERETLYQEAVEDYQKGEISSALSKLQRALEIDRKSPDRSSVDRSATYRNFYNEVRSEYDAVRNSYAEARALLESRNFAGALAICDQYLTKYPDNALFQALKFDVEERQRQRLSGFVAEVDRRVEAEPDVERKVKILEEAVLQFPDEPHFESSLRLINNRLLLVNSIVNKARYHEEQNQYSEALGQWEILKTVHGKYPGLDFEIDRVMERRDQQTRLESKTRWVEKIDDHLRGCEFANALEAVEGGLKEFPEDGELLSLQKLASHGEERLAEARNALVEGNRLFGQGNFEAGMKALRQARELDPRDPSIRATLVEKLIERAHSLFDSNWRSCDELVDQALELDPSQAAATSLRVLLEDRRREEFVGQAIAEARELQAARDLSGALAQVEQSLSFFPSETRLTRLHSVLKASVADEQSGHARRKDLDELRGLAAGTELLTEPAEIQQVLDLMQCIAARYPGEPEFQPVVESVARRLKSLALSRTSPSVAPPIAIPPRPFSAAAPSPPVPAPPAPTPASDDSATNIFFRAGPVHATPPIQTPAKVAPAPDAAALPSLVPAANAMQVATPLSEPNRQIPARSTSWMSSSRLKVAGATTVFFMIVSLGAWFAIRSRKQPQIPVPPPVLVSFTVHTDPGGAAILRGTERIGSSDSTLRLPPANYGLTIQKEGYQPVNLPVSLLSTAPASYHVTLKPLAAILTLFTPFKSGDLFLDDKPAQALSASGQFTISNLDWGKHVLRIESGGSQASVNFEIAPQSLPVVHQPETRGGVDAVAVSALRDQAEVVCSLRDLKVTVDNQEAGKLVSGEASLKGLSTGSHSLTVGGWTGNLDSGPAPALNVYLGSLASQGMLFVGVKGATAAHILVNGTERGIARKGRFGITLDPGDYRIAVAQDGFLPAAAQTVVVEKGVTKKVWFVVVPRPTVQIEATLRPLPALGKLTASVTVEVSPSNADVKYAHLGETNYQTFRLPTMELNAGGYVLVAAAPGYSADRQVIQVVAGMPLSVKFAPAPIPAVPSSVTHSMKIQDWDKPWEREGEWYAHKGGDFVFYRITPLSGTLKFVIRPKDAKKKAHWVLGYVDNRNYMEFEIDKQFYSSWEHRNGKKSDHVKKRPHAVESSDGIFLVQITVSSDHVSVQVSPDNKRFVTLDDWTAGSVNYTEGRLGFRDGMYLTNFAFTQQLGIR